MSMRRLPFVALLAPIMVLFSVGWLSLAAWVQGEQWDFVWVEPEEKGFLVWQGKATVAKHGKVFQAHMRTEHGVELRFVGAVSGEKVSGKLSILGSCFADRPFSGSYKRWRDAPPIVERMSIVLNDGDKVLMLKGFTYDWSNQQKFRDEN